MFHTYYFIERLSKSLEGKLVNATIETCFSQNKDELLIGFVLPEKNDFYIRASFTNNFNLLSFPNQFHRAKKNSVNLFEEINRAKVIRIRQFSFDRSFSIFFENDYQLLFKLYGNRSNIILIKNDTVCRIFKGSLKQDWDIHSELLDRDIDDLKIKQSDLEIIEKTFGKRLNSYLIENYQYHKLSGNEKTNICNKIIQDFKTRPIEIGYDSKPFLTLFPIKDQVTETNSPIEACNLLFDLYGRRYFLDQERNKELNILSQKLKQSENYIAKNQSKIKAIEENRSFEEIANIIMANLHTIPRNREEIILQDIYNDQPLKIRLKPNLSPQKNAEQLYRKSKNQNLEIASIKANIASKQKQINHIEQLIKAMGGAKSAKEIKSLIDNKNVSISDKEVNLPYHIRLFRDYEIRIGKHAKGNDELTFKYAKKDDIWLHARDTPGSHVIIKIKGKETVPNPVLEKAAQLAVYYSKRRNDTLCPVIYTQRKYVRKVKGGAPGKVIIEREKVIMERPAR